MPDRAQIFNRLGEILVSETDLTSVSLEESAAIREGLGLDSVDLVTVVMKIEEEYSIRLTHQELMGVNLIRDLIDLIMAKIDAGSAPQPA